MGLLQEREWATVKTLFVSREGEKKKKTVTRISSKPPNRRKTQNFVWYFQRFVKKLNTQNVMSLLSLMFVHFPSLSRQPNTKKHKCKHKEN